MKKRFLSILLAVLLLVSLLPTVAFAAGSTFKAVWNSTSATLTLYYDANAHTGEGTLCNNLPSAATAAADWGYNSYRASVKRIVIDKSVADYHGLTSTAYMFSDMIIAESLTGAEYLDVSNVTDMSYMFYKIDSKSRTAKNVNLAAPDVTNWITSNVTNMQYMFAEYGCGNIYSGDGVTAAPDVSKWDTSKVTNMSGMFSSYGYKQLTEVPAVNGAKWDTSKVTDMSEMFSSYGSKSTTLNAVPDVSKFNTAEVTNMSDMFSFYGAGSTELTKVPDVSKFNTSNVTNMSDMFSGYGAGSTSLTEVPAVNGANWNTSKVTNMSKMFWAYGCKSTTLNAVPDVSGWDTSKVTNMSEMFRDYGRSSEKLNAVPAVSNWNISSVSNMSDMFRGYACDFTLEGQPTGGSTELNVVPDITGWDISTVSNLSNFFNSYGAYSEKLDFKFDFSEWKVAGTTNVTGMFLYAAMNAKTWDVKIPTKTGERFNDAGHWYIGDGTDSTKLITPANGKAFRTDRVFDTGFKAVYHEKSKVLTFYYDAKDHGAEGEVFAPAYTPESGWTYSAKNILVESVVIDESVKDYHGLTTTAYMFQNMYRAKSITGAEYLDVSKVTDMSGMFQYFGAGFDSSPSTITVVPDVSKWDTSNVTNMSAMFQSYGAGTENTPSVIAAVPDVSGWDTSKVTDMSAMFQEYGNFSAALTEAPAVGSWKTLNVTNMSHLFARYGEFAPDLSKAPAVGNWNTSKVTNMETMFHSYAGFSTTMSEAPDVSKWDTSNVTNMGWLFAYYNGYITSLEGGTPDESSERGRVRSTLNAVPDVSNWDTSNVTTIRQMFGAYGYRSTALDKVPDVSNWDTSNMTDFISAFSEYGHHSTVLDAVPDVSNWRTSNVLSISNMFGDYGYHSTVLDAVPDVSKWDTSNLTVPSAAFREYGAASEVLHFDLDLSKWNVANFSDNSRIFMDAAAKATSWNVTIPATTGAKANDATHWYIGDGTDDTKFIVPAEGREFKIKVTHTHSFTYTANNGKITATCTAGCDKGYDTTPLTLTLTAPASLVYDGNAKAFTFADGEATAWTGAGLELPTIIYQIKQSGQSTYLPLLGTLKAVGNYMAQITVGEKTAQVEFAIGKATPYIKTNPEPTDIVYGKKLSDSTLFDGYVQVSSTNTTQVGGWFEWTNPDTVPGLDDSEVTEYDVTFTPADTNNYNTVSCKVKIKVTHTHNPVKVTGQAATETASGWKDYYKCDCGALFEDKNGTTPIENLDTWKAAGGNGYIAKLEKPEKPDKKITNTIIIEIGKKAEEQKETNPDTGAPVLNMSTGITVIAAAAFIFTDKKHK